MAENTVAETRPDNTPAGLTGLSWAHTVDRRLVHRNAVAEVLLTDVRASGPSSFLVAAQWPRSHRVYRPDQQGRPDPMLLAETIRQVGLAVSHLGFDVGDDQRAVMADLGFELRPAAEPHSIRTALEVAVAVECLDVRRRHGALSRMTVQLRFFAGGRPFAIGSGTVGWLPAASYQALRRRSRPPAPARVPAGPAPAPSHHRAGSDALLSRPDVDFPRRRLLVPVDHPVYFDHPLDHVPGLLLLDAAWQAAAQLLPTGRRLYRASLRCPVFTELFPLALIAVRPTTGDAVGFEIEQQGRVTATGTLAVGPG